jgi:hypothetical protein
MAVTTGDFDGDGYDDVMVSAPPQEYGQLFVIRGSPALPARIDLEYDPAGAIVLTDTHPGQLFGRALASADIDNDGRFDIIVGAPGDLPGTYGGLATVIFGRSDMVGAYALDDPSLRVINIYPEYSSGGLGTAVAVSDVDRNGLHDLVIGARGGDPEGCRNCGEVYALFDAANLPDTVDLANSNARITRIYGSTDYTWLGGIIDVVDGNIYDDPQVLLTSLFVQFKSYTRDTVHVCPGWLLESDTLRIRSDTVCVKYVPQFYEEGLGRSIAVADFNGDQVADIALGSIEYDNHRGRVLVVLGRKPDDVRKRPTRLHLTVGPPNPFADAIEVSYGVPSAGRIRIEVFSVRGERIVTLVDSHYPPGIYSLMWDGSDALGQKLSSGVYFLRMKALNDQIHGKAVLIR